MLRMVINHFLSMRETHAHKRLLQELPQVYKLFNGNQYYVLMVAKGQNFEIVRARLLIKQR